MERLTALIGELAGRSINNASGLQTVPGSSLPRGKGNLSGIINESLARSSLSRYIHRQLHMHILALVYPKMEIPTDSRLCGEVMHFVGMHPS